MNDRQLALRLRDIRPVKCYAIVGGERREIEIGLPGTPRRWRRVVAVARAMGADRIECLDRNDAVLDTLTLDGASKPVASSCQRDRTIWDIARGAAAGDPRDIALWQEWVEATHGLKLLEWSDKAKEILGHEPIDEILGGVEDVHAEGVHYSNAQTRSSGQST
jgi:hypothetical protein